MPDLYFDEGGGLKEGIGGELRRNERGKEGLVCWKGEEVDKGETEGSRGVLKVWFFERQLTTFRSESLTI